ncbi:hypothetical protein D5085_00525 [Ectothiorhodospiraceae bacterium BW-2]|nr:hypothetical protein D5085_00525 [Ectothiorhodospiraceae bacterium BW-2]
MKTLSVELNDQAYQQVIHFLQTLPKQDYHLLDDFDQLSTEEKQQLAAIEHQLAQNDSSDFESWDSVKQQL